MTEEQAEVTVIRTKRKRNRPKKKKNKKDPSKTSDTKDNDSITVGSDSDVSPQVSQVNESSTTRPTTTILTPQESLRQSLIAQGFSVHDIDQAMEKMWDNGLAYDQYDAVLTFLQTGGQILHDKEEDEEEDRSNVEKEIGDQATVQTVSTDDAAGEVESMSNSAAGDDDDVDVQSTSKASPSFRKTSLAEKLNMVARADKVTDAIFALTQWITKAAKPHELEELCLAQKTRALVTVFQRGMEECIDQSMFDTAVLPGLVRLVSSTFRRCGIMFEGEQLASAEHSIASLVRQTRKVVMMKPMDETDASNSNEIADKVATFIVFRMAQALEEAQFVLEMPSPAIVGLPSLPRKSQDDQVSSLIKKRETQKQAAKRASAIAQSSIDRIIQSHHGVKMSNDANQSNDECSGNAFHNATPQLVDDATKARFEERKMRLDELKRRIQEGESEKVRALQASLSKLETDRSVVRGKIADLKVMLLKLEAQEEELGAKIGVLEGNIAEEKKSDSDEAKKVQEQLEQVREEVRYGNLVGSLTGMMNAYAKTVEAATSKAMEAVAKSAMPVDFASRKTENYLQQVLEYFQTENECLGRLKTRLEDHTSKISSLKLELEQLAGLRMSTTTAQIEQTIASLDESVENDSNMLVAFTCDATSMLDDLINRLEAYLGAVKVSKDLHPIHYDLLADIQAEIKHSGICGSDRLKKYIPENTALSPVVMTEFTDTTASSVATPSPRENGKKVKKVATAVALPKLTWATLSSNPAASKIKTSFLDIQREELESKK